MLGRILKKPSSSSSFPSTAPLGSGKASPFPINPHTPRNGRKLDVTFHDRYLQPPRQPPILTSLWRLKQRKSIRKAEYRRLPAEEKKKLYLEGRSTKQKVLDWVGSKSRELVRSAGTVDAWAGPSIRPAGATRLTMADVKLLGSGNAASLKAGISDRTKRILALGMVISMGGLMGWSLLGFTGYTRAEAAELIAELDRADKAAIVEEAEKKLGVFVWGSNRYTLIEID
jgi:hypothetical protein